MSVYAVDYVDKNGNTERFWLNAKTLLKAIEKAKKNLDVVELIAVNEEVNKECLQNLML